MDFSANEESSVFFIKESNRVIKLYKKCENSEKKNQLKAQLEEIKHRLEFLNKQDEESEF
jgi:hypothetical protein